MLIWRRRAVLAVIAAGVLASGCGLALMAPIVVEGQSFPLDRATQLRAGMTADEVERLLGAPLERVATARAVVWRYDFRRQLKECRMYLGPIPLQQPRTERHALELTFGSSGLERAVYRDEAPDSTVERTLVGSSPGAG
jgi:outer membrane protein assembly factor BamE (lipoprotein component of BamABCDE complex)